jgi:pentatricopeptide repeat protein
LKPTIYTYTNLLNACVRCYDTARAEQFFNEVQSRAAAQPNHVRQTDLDLTPNEVTWTVIIKGLCQDYRIDDALQYLHQMTIASSTSSVDSSNKGKGGNSGSMKKSVGLSPNLRTLNTILRGCLRTGRIDAALSLFKRMNNDYGILPDSTSYEYLVKNLCQSMMIDDAWHYTRQLQSLTQKSSKRSSNDNDNDEQHEHDDGGSEGVCLNAPLLSSLATSCAIAGDVRRANDALDMATKAIKLVRLQHARTHCHISHLFFSLSVIVIGCGGV